jgi:hypothetical protein
MRVGPLTLALVPQQVESLWGGTDSSPSYQSNHTGAHQPRFETVTSGKKKKKQKMVRADPSLLGEPPLDGPPPGPRPPVAHTWAGAANPLRGLECVGPHRREGAQCFKVITLQHCAVQL